jgi:hypothetical protein
MSEEKKALDFDFDQWSKIAQTEPEKFEAMRQQMIDNLIAQAPDHLKPRMAGLQWQVDQIRNQAGHPMAACLQISQKMWAHVLSENGLLNILKQPRKILNAMNDLPTAKVLPFEPPPKNK